MRLFLPKNSTNNGEQRFLNAELQMNKVTLGVLLCLSALILLHLNQAVIGILAFVAGIIIMNGWQWPRR